MLTAKRTKHFTTMDGLRGIAAVIVAIYHRRFFLSPSAEWHGYLAVDFFFLLSGFVIAHAYGEKIASGRLGVSDFIATRAIRLYPMIVLGAALGAISSIVDGLLSHSDSLILSTVEALPFAMLALPEPFLKTPLCRTFRPGPCFLKILQTLRTYCSSPIFPLSPWLLQHQSLVLH